MIVMNGPRPFPRHRSGDRRRNSLPGGQRDLTVGALLISSSLLKETRLYVERLEQRVGALGLTLPQCKVLLYLANHEGISQVRLAELMNLEQMSLVRCLDGLESFGCLERRRYPADRRAHCIYFKVRGKSLVDQIRRLMNVTDREAFAGIPRKHCDLIIEVLEKIQCNFASLQALPQRALGSRPRKRPRSPGSGTQPARTSDVTGAARIEVVHLMSNVACRVLRCNHPGAEDGRADGVFEGINRLRKRSSGKISTPLQLMCSNLIGVMCPRDAPAIEARAINGAMFCARETCALSRYRPSSW